MNLIAAVDLNWGIGYKNHLLETIPGDMKHFKEKTIGKVVVMGRNTFESLPNKKPLQHRINIVLTTNKRLISKEITICHSLENLANELQKYNTNDIFIIGGEAIYSQFVDFCSTAYITKIYNTYKADKYLLNLDQQEKWVHTSTSEVYTHNKDIRYVFSQYKNIGVKLFSTINIVF